MNLLITLGTLFFLLLVGSPVVFAIGSAGIIYFVVQPDLWPIMGVYAQRFFMGMNSFVLLCIPLFILAGEIMSSSGMMKDLVRFAQLLVGRFRGGMAYVNVLVSMLFGGITGSGLADVSALGPIEITAMNEDGYEPAFSGAITATSAIQGPIIPPSIPMVLFASLTNVSVGALFFGGLVPGVCIGLGQMLVIKMMSKKRHFPKRTEEISMREAFQITKTAFFALLMPLIILGGILSGVFTPTEAAAIACGYSLIISKFVYKKLSFENLRNALATTAKTSASVYLIVAFTAVISWILAIEGLPSLIQGWVTANKPSPYFMLFLVNVFFLFNGMWLSDTAQLVLFAPLFAPIMNSLGIHPIHFGVVMVVNVMIGMITPPYGLALYLSASIAQVPLKSLVRETIPFVAISIAVLFLISYVPWMVLGIPRYLGLIQ